MLRSGWLVQIERREFSATGSSLTSPKAKEIKPRWTLQTPEANESFGPSGRDVIKKCGVMMTRNAALKTAVMIAVFCTGGGVENSLCCCCFNAAQQLSNTVFSSVQSLGPRGLILGLNEAAAWNNDNDCTLPTIQTGRGSKYIHHLSSKHPGK